ncbi:hypothetical protein QTG54_008990 [Skeletonema marinoi]|uniref:Uncharacterized protein n=1 Tax=Skeletonema marinoi TaxID=267567 RepID=A0AAD9DBX1_9STRA|nr:hypothetical protein QTG54_008990 [Skeletonema marinoi]
MKPPSTVVMVLFTGMASVVIQTEAATRASAAVYGYCMGCTEWKEKNDNFLPAVVKTASPVATYRSDFIPWPTAASLRFLSAAPAVVPISKEENREVDFRAPSMPLVTTKRMASSSPTPQKDQLLESDLPNEEESFLRLYVLVVAVATCVLTYAEKEDKLSSSSDEDDFDMLELAPTIDDEDEHEDVTVVRTMETKSRSILVGSFSCEGKCVMRKQKAEKRVHFQDLPPQEEDSKSQRTIFFSPKASIPTPYDDSKDSMPLRYTCNNNNFQDMVSVEILKLLLDDPVEKSDTSAVMPNNFAAAAAATENKEEESQDVVEASSTTPKELDENETSSADSSMMNEYEDFLFQVRHSLQ